MSQDTASMKSDEARALMALGALAQAQRLRAFRALVKAGPQGLTPGVLSTRLGLAPSALSFHLKELAAASLVTSEPRGRHLVYRADFARMDHLLAYLMEHCCQGACDAAAGADCEPQEGCA
jgi:ArsR family transcriptional regulator, arsenate/arsenite/antimonite-responsive transcriptional repressor